MPRPSARSRAGARPTGPSARRRFCGAIQTPESGTALERRRRRRCFARSCRRALRWSRSSASPISDRPGRSAMPRSRGISASLVDAEPYASIDEVFRAAESGQTDYAVVPVENSTEGAVGRTLDLMCQTPLTIVGEDRLRVQQNLLARASRSPRSTRVYSHAQSLAQCVQWLAQHLPSCSARTGREQRRGGAARGAEPGSAAIAGDSAPPRSTSSTCSRRTSRTIRTTRRASGCSDGRRVRLRAATKRRW